MDIRQFLYNKVGDVFTETDYVFCIGQLDKIDRLAQDVANLKRVPVLPQKKVQVFP